MKPFYLKISNELKWLFLLIQQQKKNEWVKKLWYKTEKKIKKLLKINIKNI